MSSMERGGYWVGPSRNPHHMTAVQHRLDVADPSDPFLTHDVDAAKFVATALAAMEGALRKLASDPSAQAKARMLLSQYGGLSPKALQVLETMLEPVRSTQGASSSS